MKIIVYCIKYIEQKLLTVEYIINFIYFNICFIIYLICLILCPFTRFIYNMLAFHFLVNMALLKKW